MGEAVAVAVVVAVALVAVVVVVVVSVAADVGVISRNQSQFALRVQFRDATGFLCQLSDSWQMTQAPTHPGQLTETRRREGAWLGSSNGSSSHKSLVNALDLFCKSTRGMQNCLQLWHLHTNCLRKIFSEIRAHNK